jgi:hypothetical protein
MTNAQKMALITEIFNMIFASKQVLTNEQWGKVPAPQAFAGNMTYWGPRLFVNGTVRGVDIEVNVGDRILSLRFMEQNANKTDKNGNLKQTAIRARSGERIMWVVDRKAQVNAFLGSMQNGTWVASQDRATVPAQPQVIQMFTADGGVQALPGNIQSYEQARAYMDNKTAAGAALDRFSTNNVPDMPAYTNTPQYVVQTMENDMTDFDPSMYDDEDIPEWENYDEPY